MSQWYITKVLEVDGIVSELRYQTGTGDRSITRRDMFSLLRDIEAHVEMDGKIDCRFCTDSEVIVIE